MSIQQNLNGGKFMEPHSQADANEYLVVVESQIRECFGRVVYSHKTHEKCADIALNVNNRLKLFQIILSAIITTSLIVKIVGDTHWAIYVAALLSTLQFGINAYTKDFDLGEIAQKHSHAASSLWNIRELYFSLLTDIRTNRLSLDQIAIERNKIQELLNSIYKGSPRTNSKAYAMATKSLKLNEELTFSDLEIDNFLPNELKKNST